MKTVSVNLDAPLLLRIEQTWRKRVMAGEVRLTRSGHVCWLLRAGLAAAAASEVYQ